MFLRIGVSCAINSLSNALLPLQNEKRERIVRASRDITRDSKKLIFALHRYDEPFSVFIYISD